jgi:NADPH:quinone reductase-like Zn-dependent oxidoreductase
MPPGITPILGLEYAGTIAAVGGNSLKDSKGVPWKEGDEVFGLVYGGAYAEYVPVDARLMMRKPQH